MKILDSVKGLPWNLKESLDSDQKVNLFEGESVDMYEDLEVLQPEVSAEDTISGEAVSVP